jgi:lipoyl(octanoyl) transferase
MRSFVAHWLGRVPYAETEVLQETLLRGRLAGTIGDTLLLLEHEPVITFGRAARAQNVLVSRSELARRGVEVHETKRGGDVTYHGPGQLVAYPIFDLRPDRCDVRRYVRDLARVMMSLSGQFGLEASFIEGDPKLVGVWVDAESPTAWMGDPRTEGGARAPAKIGAIGVRISRWVTTHGFAYNVSTELDRYRWIVPCGVTQYGVTSLAESGVVAAHTVEWTARAAIPHFEAVFQAEGRWATGDDSRAMGSLASA